SVVVPPFGALLLGLMPLYGVLAIDIVTAAFAITTLFFVSIPQPVRSVETGRHESLPVRSPGHFASLWADVRQGFRTIWHWPGLRPILFMTALTNLFYSPVSSLLPILVTKHFGGGVAQLGWLESTSGIGLVCGGLVLSVWGGFRRRVVTSMTGLIG